MNKKFFLWAIKYRSQWVTGQQGINMWVMIKNEQGIREKHILVYISFPQSNAFQLCWVTSISNDHIGLEVVFQDTWRESIFWALIALCKTGEKFKVTATTTLRPENKFTRRNVQKYWGGEIFIITVQFNLPSGVCIFCLSKLPGAFLKNEIVFFLI